MVSMKDVGKSVAAKVKRITWLNVSIDAELKEECVKVAKELDRPVAYVVRIAIRRYLRDYAGDKAVK